MNSYVQKLLALRSSWIEIHLALLVIMYYFLENTLLDVFSGHISLAVLACVFFLTISYLATLASVIELRPRSSAEKIFSARRDTDYILDHEIEISCLRPNKISQFFKKSFEFCSFRPVYGLIFIVGAVLFAIFLLIRLTIDINSQKELHIASSMLILPCMIVTGTVLVLASLGIYVRDSKPVSSYQDFNERIEIPMKIVAGRTLAAFTTDGWMNFVGTLVILALTSISAYYLDHVCNFMPDAAFERLRMRTQIANTRMFLVLALNFSTFASFILLAHSLVIYPFMKAKRCLLAIVEKNWRRNIPAIESILQDVDVESLEELLAALKFKRTQRLTEAEKRAFNYVDLPLWQTKLPFVDYRRQINLQSTSSEYSEQPNGMSADESPEEPSTSRMSANESPEEPSTSRMSANESPEEQSTSGMTEKDERVALKGIRGKQSVPSKAIKESARVLRKDSKPYQATVPRSKSESAEVREATKRITRQQSVPSITSEGAAGGIRRKQSVSSKAIKESARVAFRESV